MKIAFIHPDLGIGGAERLIVDAALGLQKEGHKVHIYTSHCDKNHCFEEIKKDELKVSVYGDFLPTHFQNKFKIVFAFLRQLVLIFNLIISGEISQYDYFIIDQLSYGIPILHLFHETHARILFYCHFPDQQLAKHDGFLRSLYRAPFDLLEQFSMSSADSVVVNSKFTKTIYDSTFKIIKDSLVPDVIYPCVDLTKEEISTETKKIFNTFLIDQNYFLSINRFEKKKNIELAIRSYALFLKEYNVSSNSVKLVITGGYDPLLEENKDYLQHLEKLVDDLNLTKLTVFNNQYSKYFDDSQSPEFDILFLPSISSNLKEFLLANAKLLTYTPSFEHFGIVPLEAMKFGTPVLAVNNGGPVESIVSLDEDPLSGTGWLEPSDAKTWSKILNKAYKLKDDLQISKNGEIQLNEKFSLAVLTKGFELNLLKTLKTPYKRYSWERLLHLWKVPFFIFLKTHFEDLYAYAIIILTFIPPSIFQLIGIVAITAFYLVAPEWFVKRW